MSTPFTSPTSSSTSNHGPRSQVRCDRCCSEANRCVELAYCYSVESSAEAGHLGLSYADLAAKINSTEARVTQSQSPAAALSIQSLITYTLAVVTGEAPPTSEEFKALSEALGITDVRPPRYTKPVISTHIVQRLPLPGTTSK